MKDSFDERVRSAEGRKKIFDNRVKYILFFLTVGTGVITFWDKCSSISHKVDVAQQQSSDSISKEIKSPSRKETASVSHRRHYPQNAARPRGNELLVQDQKNEKVEEPLTKALPKTVASIQTVNLDKIEFELLSAEGSIRAQTIKMTVILKTSAASWYIYCFANSIVDPEGNEYQLKSYMNGISVDSRVELDTDVPMKRTYTFGGILPNVRLIKLFKLQYSHPSLGGDLHEVQFRDIPVDWR